ncbi:UNVERIFIED_CONTAM: cell surface protein [Streptococcus canis]|uniref:MSCRAMM family protein n=1 Tax=Streptococcus canis TaxID=1329 RepID=UPI00138833ED|nr:SpaA isopeptide-forming pilin-related protein [Streptococcus canis]MDV6000315.1 cell surface protein [Streptococcus canis]QKG74915.1 cell surface protein [Streptococcus canis]GFG42284.1 hypothetical protein ScFU29_11880 [Streptococcus canis]GMX39136.1 hypothetical protein ScKU71_03590 [Streptococcus canis]
MTLKKGLICLFCLLALCSLLVGGGLSVKAKDANNTLAIQLQDYQDVVKALGDKQPQQLKVWQLSGEFSQKPTKEVFDRLKSWDEDKLDAKFASLALEMTFTSDHIEVTGIPNGRYFVKDIIQSSQLRYHSELLFDLDGGTEKLTLLAKPVWTQLRLHKIDQDKQPLKGVGFRLYRLGQDGRDQAVPLNDTLGYARTGKSDRVLYTDDSGYITISKLPFGNYRFVEVEPLSGYKVTKKEVDVTIRNFQLVTIDVINEKESGSFNFLKVDGATKKSLEGASFKITQLHNQEYKPVIQNGKELVLTSDKDGRFVAEDLAFGTYYAWEIKSPSGFVQLNQPISFKVDKHGDSKEVLVVQNRKRPIIDVPNTGDASLYILLVLAGLTFSFGYYLTKAK